MRHPDIAAGLAFSSDDFGSEEAGSALLIDLKNGIYEISASEDIYDSTGIAKMELSGTVYENGSSLSMKGTLNICAQEGDAFIIEEGNYSLVLQSPPVSSVPTDMAAAAEQPAGKSCSTDERPGLADFLWYLDGV